MNKEEFIYEFDIKTKKLGYMLNRKQQEEFYEYMNLLLEWNEKINLTAITQPSDIIIKHFIDSMTVLKYIKSDSSVVDIGTGAGFPGIPLKIIEPNLQVSLVDSLNKRINFLDEVVTKLMLKDILTIHSRAEDFGKNKEYRESFDIAISRAVARMNVLVEYLLPTVKVGGYCICMKGSDSQEEIEEADTAIRLLGGRIEKIDEFCLPDTDIKRTVILIKKISNTPNKYPRRSGMPAKEPIK